MNFHFDHPELLWLLLLAIPAAEWGRRCLKALSPLRRRLAVGLRVALLAGLALMLAGPVAVWRHEQLTVVAVLDGSQSVRQFYEPPAEAETGEPRRLETWLTSWLTRASEDQRPSDRLGRIDFDGRPRVEALPGEGVEAASAESGAAPLADGTDIGGAIRLALAMFPPESGARLLLASDGNDTQGSTERVLAAAREASAAGVRVDVLPLSYEAQREVMVEAVHAPVQASEGQSAAVRIVLRATEPMAGRLQLLQDGQPVDLDPGPARGLAVSTRDWTRQSDAEAAAGRWALVETVQLELPRRGLSRYRAIFEPAGGDSLATNNEARAVTLVSGKGRVLVVDGVGGESGQVLPDSLRRRGIELEVVPPAGLPSELGDLQRYDAVVLQDVPAEAVSPPQQAMLAEYVHELGGGFAMIGGPNSFGAGGWTNTRVDRILPVNCEIPDKAVLPSGALVLVIDRSGSMGQGVGATGRTQLELAAESAVLALNTLFPRDLIGVIAFDSSAGVVVEIQPADNPREVAKRIYSIQSGGGTNIYAGLNLARKQLQGLEMQDAAVRHVVLLSDGESTEPMGGSYHELVRDMAISGISLSTVGVGDSHDRQLLARLAGLGDGRYHPIQDPQNLPQVFIKEARTIRQNLVREERFVPERRRTGSPVLSGVGDVPPLDGFVLTERKRDPRVFLPLVGPDDRPVFAHWQVGLGRSAAFTSDATNRWAAPWLGWGGYADFWARTMRLIARPSEGRGVDLFAEIQSDRIVMRLDTGGGEEGDAARRVHGAVLGPDGEAREVELEQTAPGLYEGSAPAAETGSYVANLVLEGEGGERTSAFAAASRSPGEELRRLASSEALLEQVAEITGGRVLSPDLPEQAGLFDRDQPIVSWSARPLWPVLLWLIIPLLLLDVACRRIAWDAAAVRRKLREQLGFGREGERAEAQTLAALRRTRDETRQQSEARRKQRFEAEPETKASSDLSAQLGGAAKEPAPRETAQQTPAGAEGDGEPEQEDRTTSRLLAARQRARQRYDQEEQK
ncbi:MAG: VWA domain-containing protein [Phycisphaeraceae bacterium]